MSSAAIIADRLLEIVAQGYHRIAAESAEVAIRQAHAAGVRDSESLREYARQREAHWAALARIETRRVLRRLSTTARTAR